MITSEHPSLFIVCKRRIRGGEKIGKMKEKRKKNKMNWEGNVAFEKAAGKKKKRKKEYKKHKWKL